MSWCGKISIAMAIYNGERFVKEQLDSFARQTRLPDELVVSDDCSTDSSVSIVREFAEGAPFPIKLECHTRNVGMNGNVERAIRAASGDIIVMADWDDVQYPQKIAAIEEAFRTHPGAGLVICDADIVDEELNAIGTTLWQARGFRPSERLKHAMASGGAFSSSMTTNGYSIAFKRKYKELVLPIPNGRPRPIIHDFLLPGQLFFPERPGSPSSISHCLHTGSTTVR